MVRLNLEQIKTSINNNLPRLPKALGMITFGSGGIYLARECCLLAQDCTKSGMDLSSHILSQKGLESVNSAGILASSLITKCSPNLYNFVGLSIGVAATCLLTYRYARDTFGQLKPALPSGPSPHRAKKSE